MWIKYKYACMEINDIRKDGAATIRISKPADPRDYRLTSYSTPQRAKEVVSAFWDAVKKGESFFEFPEE